MHRLLYEQQMGTDSNTRTATTFSWDIHVLKDCRDLLQQLGCCIDVNLICWLLCYGKQRSCWLLDQCLQYCVKLATGTYNPNKTVGESKDTQTGSEGGK